MGKVQFRLPDSMLYLIRRMYPEAGSESEAVKMLLLEMLTGVVEKRDVPEDLPALARVELLKMRPEYARLLEGVVSPYEAGHS